jgi:hypothetical protein
MTFRDRPKSMFAQYYAVAGHFEALVREIDIHALVRKLFGWFKTIQKAFAFLSILKII